MARKKKSKCTMSFSGYDEIIHDIERLGGDIPKAIEKAIEKSGEVATHEYLKTIDKHRYSGLTEDAIEENLKAKNDGKKITLQTGFNIGKGGVASIWLDRGTPSQKPVKFIQKIKRNKAVKGAIEETLDKEVKKLL